MGSLGTLVYGVLVYVFFFITFCYSIGFVEGIGVPKGINDGAVASFGVALITNVALLGLFGLQHSAMARPQFKEWWCTFVPRPAERSTFVLLATAILALLMWQWRPMPGVIWDFKIAVVRTLLYTISLGGWLLVLYATFVIDHFDLFGLRQTWLSFKNIEYKHPQFMARSVYRVIRHPIMAGFIIAFWAAPTMTVGRLLFAAVSTAYILVAIQLEERDLNRMLGDDYREYRRHTPMLVPSLVPRRRA